MIICVGEIVWDVFESRQVLGGAPLNVAYHLNDLGHNTHLISRVGTDAYGVEALAQLVKLGLSVDHIQIDQKNPTGTVQVFINEDNEPSFEIVSPAAWDFINLSQMTSQVAKSYHLVLGTLAQRSVTSRTAIHSLWSSADTVFYDVNLRPPFTSKENVLESLAHAHVAKMNEDELNTIHKWANLDSGDIDQMARLVLARFDLEVLAVTLGAAGAMLVCGDGIFRHDGFPVEVVDTVGSGDAFFAGLINGILNRHAWQDCLKQANRRGAYVASLAGATPKMNKLRGVP